MKPMSRMLIVGVMLLCSAVTEAAGPPFSVTNLPLTGIGGRAHDIVIQETLQGPFAGTFAYVATDEGLTIVDITNPTHPVARGNIDLGGETMGVAVKGTLAFLANTATDFNVVNVANPDSPQFVASRRVGGAAYDVAVKDNYAYVVSFAGEMYVYEISSTGVPTQKKVIGLPAWKSPQGDAGYIPKMKAGLSSGSGKAFGVSVTGNTLLAVEGNYGRGYYFSVQNPSTPVFKGTHYAPFLFRVAANPTETVAYNLATYGAYSGVYTVTLASMAAALEQNDSTSYTDAACSGSAPTCSYSRGPSTDYGGIAVSSNGRYVVYIAGKKGSVTVLNTCQPNPVTMTTAGSVIIPYHGMKTLEAMGVAIKGDYIYAAAGTLGVAVFSFPGLSAGPACTN